MYKRQNVYHLNPPTAINKVGDIDPIQLDAQDQEHRHHHIKTRDLNSKGDAISARVPLFFNSDVILSKAIVDDSMEYLYRNGHHDECLFVHGGKGTLRTNFGSLRLSQGDYAIIPRGVIWQLDVKESLELLIAETVGPIQTPDRYRNELGQLLEHAPYSDCLLYTSPSPRD